MVIAFLVSISIILLDQYIKYLTVTHLNLGESAPGLEGIFDFFYIQNDGAGFGLFSGQMWLFYLATVLVVGYIIFLVFKNRHSKWYLMVSYGLVIGGALGNFIDRIRLGYVIDMFRLQFIDFPIFNIADMSLTFGVIGLILIILFTEEGEDIL